MEKLRIWNTSTDWSGKIGAIVKQSDYGAKGRFDFPFCESLLLFCSCCSWKRYLTFLFLFCSSTHRHQDARTASSLLIKPGPSHPSQPGPPCQHKENKTTRTTVCNHTVLTKKTIFYFWLHTFVSDSIRIQVLFWKVPLDFPHFPSLCLFFFCCLVVFICV